MVASSILICGLERGVRQQSAAAKNGEEGLGGFHNGKLGFEPVCHGGTEHTEVGSEKDKQPIRSEILFRVLCVTGCRSEVLGCI